jgi:hypothetical protein
MLKDEAPRFVTPVDKELPTKDVEVEKEWTWDDTMINNEMAVDKKPFIIERSVTR